MEVLSMTRHSWSSFPHLVVPLVLTSCSHRLSLRSPLLVRKSADDEKKRDDRPPLHEDTDRNLDASEVTFHMWVATSVFVSGFVGSHVPASSASQACRDRQIFNSRPSLPDPSLGSRVWGWVEDRPAAAVPRWPRVTFTAGHCVGAQPQDWRDIRCANSTADVPPPHQHGFIQRSAAEQIVDVLMPGSRRRSLMRSTSSSLSVFFAR